jgi:hypothetical protein
MRPWLSGRTAGLIALRSLERLDDLQTASRTRPTEDIALRTTGR